MLKEVVEAMGQSAIIPAVMVVLAGYVVSTFIGLHRTKSQQRIAFLELWKGRHDMDDMAFEVAVRHLCGTYLPASVIRKICERDHCGEGLFEVARLWPLFSYDRTSGSVRWDKPEYAQIGKLKWASIRAQIGYFLVAFVAVGFLLLAIAAGPRNVLGWIFGVNALLWPVIAFSLLAKGEAFALAQRIGTQWLDRLNPASESVAPSALT